MKLPDSLPGARSTAVRQNPRPLGRGASQNDICKSIISNVPAYWQESTGFDKTEICEVIIKRHKFQCHGIFKEEDNYDIHFRRQL